MGDSTKEDLKEVTNSERTWQDIMQEVGYNSKALWSYVTALRGPDVDTGVANVKAVFTCPLRGRCPQAQDVKDFLALDQDEIEACFEIVCKQSEKFQHYLLHVVEAWLAIFPTLGEMLKLTFGGYIKPKKATQIYVNLLNKWLHHTSVVGIGDE